MEGWTILQDDICYTCLVFFLINKFLRAKKKRKLESLRPSMEFARHTMIFLLLLCWVIWSFVIVYHVLTLWGVRTWLTKRLLAIHNYFASRWTVNSFLQGSKVNTKYILDLKYFWLTFVRRVGFDLKRVIQNWVSLLNIPIISSLPLSNITVRLQPGAMQNKHNLVHPSDKS